MNVLERVLEKRIRCQVSIDNMQFGFMSAKGNTDAIFIMRQVQEKHQAKKKKLYYAFVSRFICLISECERYAALYNILFNDNTSKLLRLRVYFRIL